MQSFHRGLEPHEREYLQREVDDIYQRFVDVVAKGRRLSRGRVEEISEGKVYTGAQAVRIGLCDSLGGLHAAIAKESVHTSSCIWRCL